ncbi:MAG: RagB/SusD family nutrient uptake outer membrane protein [Reichenbachiella sp.]
MKLKYIKIITALFLVGVMGCQDLLEDPKSELTPDNFLQNEIEMEGAVASMYRSLARSERGWGFTFRLTNFFGADDITTHFTSNKEKFRDFDKFAGTAANDWAHRNWWGPWDATYNANNILDNIDNIDASQEYKDEAAGQAYFIRGISFYYMVRIYGKIPLVTTAVISSELPERAPIADVYAQIVEDLKRAEELLPASFPEPGKATKWSAKSFLSDVYLTMAGWPLNETSNYALSAAAAKEVIDEGPYSLVDNYAEVFQTNGNSESVFGLFYNVAGGLPARSFGASGVPEDEPGGWHDYHAELNFFRNAPVCQRTDDTFLTTFKTRDADGVWGTLDWTLSATGHPFYKKFRAGLVDPSTGLGDGVAEDDTEIFSVQASTNKSLDVMRYAQVLLNYTEASAMAGSVTALTYDAINDVRDRAGLPDLTPGLTGTTLQDSVVFERAYECAAEFGVRWFDICRLQLLPEVLAARDAAEIPVSPAVLADPSPFYLSPIPINEMSINQHWEQNPGY